ncbi:2-amino-4-hydroxy-6-hydroxymethyldihydropteridine diphosphokinase [Hyphomicrobium sp.]|uniref:2-amino-4-hydroxy-6- hydroxymethyldihydropteridine diphosphokinase n=1 Tax=Hyphomicrobium sp. TaxID=82 RepID=UPI001DD3F539|nr:2-amino-4-hydroxy-6-hydroxymethyldihydropteridine diphosphokinase [Hyphomicrobium sp.]MBY0560518.1 2-amino-4-hydroxy-6-hydroxymethyldihydropteridine diphosphokinase [Hyphomicrobium sp.]
MANAERARAELQGAAGASDAILALGTNLGNRIENIEEAIRRLTADGSIRLVSRSKLYRSAPWGVTDQDWFINACIAIQTTLSPHELLKRCQAVENDMGRVRTMRWGPRIIDVDILTFGDLTIAEPDLTVPHPLIGERAFVLVPLKDVAPELRLNGRSIDAMLEKLDGSEVEAVQP